MLLSFPVIVDAHQNHFPEISLERVPIILTLNLVDSRIGILIVFQFEYNSRQVNVSVRYHYDICEAFAPPPAVPVLSDNGFWQYKMPATGRKPMNFHHCT